MDGGRMREYLIYAFGEVILVMTGILLALQVNNWNEKRKDKIQWRIHIQSMAEEIKMDISTLDRAIKTENKIESSAKVVIPILESRQKRILDSLAFILAFNDMTYSSNIQKRTTTWDMLNSTGALSDFPDPQLLNMLQDYYSDYVRITANYMESGHPTRLELRKLKYELFTDSDHRKFFPAETPEVPSEKAFQAIFKEIRVLPLCRYISGASRYFSGRFESIRSKADSIIVYMDSTQY